MAGGSESKLLPNDRLVKCYAQQWDGRGRMLPSNIRWIHTHKHTTDDAIVRSVRRRASTGVDDRRCRCTSAIHGSLHRQQIRE